LLCLLLRVATTLAALDFYQEILLLFVWSIPVSFILWKEKSKSYFKNAVAIGMLIVLFIAANSLYELKNAPQTQLSYEFSLAKEGRALADDMNIMFPKVARPAVGVIAAGGFALKYEGITVDLMGLNNTLMGHSPGQRIGFKNHAAFNKEVFYKLNADIILPQQIRDTTEAKLQYANLLHTDNFDNMAMKNIFNDSLFKQQYQCIMLADSLHNKNIFAFATNRFINKINALRGVAVYGINFR